jgi:hypothetical protein
MESTNEIKEDKPEECQELKNIKYKSMLLTGVNTDHKPVTKKSSVSSVEHFLEQESKSNKSEPWSRLDKTYKIKQLADFVDGLNDTAEYKLTAGEMNDLKQYLTLSLDKKKIQHVKDVQYDKTTGKIKAIPSLHFNPVSRKFTLKRCEKRVSTLKSLGRGKKIDCD